MPELLNADAFQTESLFLQTSVSLDASVNEIFTSGQIAEIPSNEAWSIVSVGCRAVAAAVQMTNAAGMAIFSHPVSLVNLAAIPLNAAFLADNVTGVQQMILAAQVGQFLSGPLRVDIQITLANGVAAALAVNLNWFITFLRKRLVVSVGQQDRFQAAARIR